MNWELMDNQREMFAPTTLEGFTSSEYMARYKLGQSHARSQLAKLLKMGRIELLGVRPGANHEKAYRLIDAKTNRRPRP